MTAKICSLAMLKLGYGWTRFLSETWMTVNEMRFSYNIDILVILHEKNSQNYTSQVPQFYFKARW